MTEAEAGITCEIWNDLQSELARRSQKAKHITAEKAAITFKSISLN